MYATSQYSGVNYNNEIEYGHSGKHCQHLNHHSRPFNVSIQVSSGLTNQPLTHFRAFMMQKHQPSLPKRAPTALALPLPVQVVASCLSSCHAHGGNLEAQIIVFEESQFREQGVIPALGWILVRLPTFSYCDAFLVNDILYKDHVFMSISPPNGLEVSNLAHRATADELREQLLSMWPSGVVHQHHYGRDWHVRFAGRPWNPKGHQFILFVSSNTYICYGIDLTISYRSQRMICRIFSVLGAQVRFHIMTRVVSIQLRMPFPYRVICI